MAHIYERLEPAAQVCNMLDSPVAADIQAQVVVLKPRTETGPKKHGRFICDPLNLFYSLLCLKVCFWTPVGPFSNINTGVPSSLATKSSTLIHHPCSPTIASWESQPIPSQPRDFDPFPNPRLPSLSAQCACPLACFSHTAHPVVLR